MMTYAYDYQTMHSRDYTEAREFEVLNQWGRDGWRLIERRQRNVEIPGCAAVVLVFERAHKELV